MLVLLVDVLVQVHCSCAKWLSCYKSFCLRSFLQLSLIFFLFNCLCLYNLDLTIVGAHTLGRARVDASGFQQPWVDNEFGLDNQFYIDVLDRSKNWTLVSTLLWLSLSTRGLIRLVEDDWFMILIINGWYEATLQPLSLGTQITGDFFITALIEYIQGFQDGLE